MPLSDAKIKAAKAEEKPYKLRDEKALYLYITPNGSKLWRLKYRYQGKEKTLSFGAYPETTLADARKKRDAAKALLKDKIDPMEQKKIDAIALERANENSFEAVAKEWLLKRGKKSDSGDKRLIRLLEKDLFPYLGNRPIHEIKPPELLQVLRRVEERGAIETAHRANQYAGQIFRYAIASARAERDPSADLRGALSVPTETHFAAITDPKQFAKLLMAIDEYRATPVVQAALKLSPLLFCRPGELRHMEWSEVNWDNKQIELPSEKMKLKQPHIIPLSTQALTILSELRPLTGRGKYVFPSARGASRPLSDNGVRTALRSLGYANEEMTVHGFRATARTLLDEQLNFPIEIIEQQLAHQVRDHNGRAYNRTKHLAQRKDMMQAWSDYLDDLKVQ
ncbi:MAG TPA: integrase arm-type DNA-binding domain-containing protein [Cellvibrio sp.]|nr:integrase arm-type DNA-binding domain-containing protein [Cellvibrio sp.]